MLLTRNPALRLLRIVGFAEAISWLLLLFIAMPLKYMAGQPYMVSIVGAAHGALFILYILQLIFVKFKMKWEWMFVIKGFIASIFPFGTLIYDRKLREREQ